MKRVKGLWALLVGAVLVAAPAVGDQAEAQAPRDTVTVGHLGFLSDAGIFIALEKGYFEEQNIEVELQQFGSATDQVELLAGGTLDVGSGALGPELFNAIARGIRIRTVADKGSVDPGFGFNVFVVRQDLLDSGRVKTAADLKGLTFGTESIVSNVLVEYDALLKAGGLTLDDVHLAVLPQPQVPAALASKELDAAIVAEPFGTIIEAQGIGTILFTMDEFVPGFQIAPIFYSPHFAEGRRDVAVRWMATYVKGLRFYNEAFRDPAGKEELIGILMKYTPVKDRALYERMIWPGLDPDGRVNGDSIMEQQRFLHERALVPSPVPMEQIIDHSFVEAALAIIGN